ncbi:MAG: methionine--tRNA ligase [Myxococcales bacterium]|nr:methionine--tRNA ligase [Myxococcales bacterium]
MRSFYVTTPIYYVNDRPHIGHAYTTVAADLLARYHRVRGQPTRLLTGLDEHGQKIERRAAELGLPPKEFVDAMVPPFKEAWEQLRCEPDDFIRTTEPRHEEKVQALWRKLEAAGDIYLGEYEDWYCVGCESFKTEKDLEEGQICPMHGKPVEKLKERSYFFRLSAYGDKLLAYYEAHPEFVQPEGRFNEVKSFVRQGLRDLSISRTTMRWGVPVPGDEAHVMFVWLDALTNYISALGGPDEAPLFDQFWGPEATKVHLVGKDILRFHAIYWPAFLLSAGIELPTQIWAHGWLTVDGTKMSKGLGNFLPPGPLVDAFGADVLRYYLMREVGFGQDGDFSHTHLIERYNGELANGLGNLLNRMLASIVRRGLGGVVPVYRPDALEPIDRELIEVARRVGRECAEHLEAISPHRALESIWELVAAANRYVDQTEPWHLLKDPARRERLEQVAYQVLECLRWIGTLLWPFMPDRCDALRAQLGLGPLEPAVGEDLWPDAFGQLEGGLQTAPGAALFPRIDAKQEAEILARLERDRLERAPMPGPAAEAGEPQEAEAEPLEPIAPPIVFDDFAKVDLRVGKILAAEKLSKSKKLLRLQIDLGEAEPRVILAGIALSYPPEALIGRRVVVVANLPPRKMMGVQSQGMVLAASDAGGLGVLCVDRDVPPGTRVS